jgi:hypothetical protein
VARDGADDGLGAEVGADGEDAVGDGVVIGSGSQAASATTVMRIAVVRRRPSITDDPSLRTARCQPAATGVGYRRST